MNGIFTGLRVIELSSDIAGSFTGQVCADRGAEVIKTEPLIDPDIAGSSNMTTTNPMAVELLRCRS